MSTERALRHRNGYITRETSLGEHSIHNLSSPRSAQQRNIQSKERIVPGSHGNVKTHTQFSFSDGQHKIMNYKLEDFDMVKTIGTGMLRTF